MPIDVTDKVTYGAIDDENMSLTKCVCGHKYAEWNFILGVDSCAECRWCGRKFYFKVEVKVFEVKDG